MSFLYLTQEEQGIVVFRIWQSLAYIWRILLSFMFIIAGFVTQYAMDYALFPGCWLILAGNLLLIVKGYDNRVKAGKYSPSSSWEKVDKSKLYDVEKLHKDMKVWDRSAIDVTHWMGVVTLVVVAIPIGGAVMTINKTLNTIAWDAVILLLPHWITGIRSILTKPILIMKIQKFRKLVKMAGSSLINHKVNYYMLITGDEVKMPDDVKIRVSVKNEHEDFLGLYGQIVTNDVNGTSYPYFYVVLVAKKDFGLKDAYNNYAQPRDITKEFKIEGDVEVFVIRQATTKTSGYHTNDKKMVSIFRSGINMAEKVAVKGK